MKNKTKKLIIRDRLSDLFVKAGVPISEECIINVSDDIEHVFKGCETSEEAIQRIRELHEINAL